MPAGFFATDVRRESACPVHFVWDGNGRGRPLVRMGFLGALVAGACASAAVMCAAPLLRDVAGGVAVLAGVCWLGGQVLTRRVRA